MANIKWEQIAVMNQHYKKYSFDYFLAAQEKLGIKNIELWCGAPHFWLDSVSYSNCREIKKKAQSYGIKIVSTASPSYQWQYQCASQKKEYWEKSLQYYTNGVRAAAELGAKIMVLNSGWGYWNENPEVSRQRALETVVQLCEAAKREGIILAMESLQPNETNIVITLDQIKRFYDQVNHPNLKIMIDSAAVGSNGETIEQWFQTFGDEIVHTHYIDRGVTTHNGWGDGNYPLEQQLECFNAYNYSGYFVQELLAPSYFKNPIRADQNNIRVLERFVED
ncbi:sugar phosphate isomerase/epimerase family protein [Youxingia wuxianensis]|uniref:Sugar phosphate isomerase/epimerase n=1 Tax=Youxingia wuxianensis TaxID=2763678 RepID=A0A926IG94_9FIRM|nr:sugar phosphate isomerase/epimerase family protein [Youxingia wuxianensis]MBC8584639.1 sugar phosphate isomerase/epimerase [Youxingia wuxianensis]